MKVSEPKRGLYAVHFESGIDDFYFDKQSARFAVKSLEGMSEESVVDALILCGPSGCGKTHLVKGFYEDWVSANPEKLSAMVTAEQLVGELVRAAAAKPEADFDRWYGSYDLLIVDDAFALMGKDATQARVGELLGSICAGGGKVVLVVDGEASDAYNALRKSVDNRTDRAFTADMAFPDTECKKLYARYFIESSGLAVPNELVDIFSAELQTIGQIRSAITACAAEHSGRSAEDIVALYRKDA